MFGETRKLPDSAWWAVGLWAGLTLLDLKLMSRSAAGAMTAALSAPIAIGSTLSFALAALAALILWRHTQRPGRSGTRQEFHRPMKGSEVWATSVTKSIAGGTWRDWLPELATITLSLVWMLFVGWGSTPFTQGGLFACGGLLIVAAGLVNVWGVTEVSGKTASDQPGVLEGRESEVEGATQWQKRLVVDGRELIEGVVSVDFAAGQKEAVVHLSFCPPLATTPEIHAEDSEGGDLDIRTQAAHSYGARLTARRPGDVAAAETRQISYTAMLAPLAESAA